MSKDFAMVQLVLQFVTVQNLRAPVRSALAWRTQLVPPRRVASLHAHVATLLVLQDVLLVQALWQLMRSNASWAVAAAIPSLSEHDSFL
jgi:hypothetical protein